MLESMWDLNSPTGDQTGSLALKLRVLTNEPSEKSLHSLQVYVKTHLWSLWDVGPLISSPHQPRAVEWWAQSSSGKKAGKEDDKRPLQSAKGTQILRLHPEVKKGHGSLHVRTLGSVDLNQDQLSLPDTSYFHWQSWWWTWFSYVKQWDPWCHIPELTRCVHTDQGEEGHSWVNGVQKLDRICTSGCFVPP